jgi:hypothetical protein
MGDTTNSGKTGEATGESAEAPKVVESDSTEDKKFTHTQADIDAAVKNRVKREEEKYGKLETEYANFKASVGDVDGLKKTVEDLSTEKDELSSTKTNLEKELLRVKAAYDAGLSEKSFKFLSGNTEDELKANAKELKELEGASVSRVGNILSKDYDGANAGINKTSPLASVFG